MCLLFTSLGLKWSERGGDANGLDFEMGSEIRKPNHFNRDKYPPFHQNHLKSGQKHSDFKWSSFQMVGDIAMAIAKA